MPDRKRYRLAVIGRAGLANELFAVLRAEERADAMEERLLPACWFRVHIGPYLRRERDHRVYWRLFSRPTAAELAEKAVALMFFRGRTAFEIGMGEHFGELRQGGAWHAERLRRRARPGVIRARATPGRYLALHIRLGDFARGTLDDVARRNSTAAPIEWYRDRVQEVLSQLTGVPVVVCSDGSDAELAAVLSLPNVSRSTAANALDDLFTLADATAMIGSRSTFTALAAFLGSVPLLLPPGANAYRPHASVWEGERVPSEWLDVIRSEARSGQ